MLIAVFSSAAAFAIEAGQVKALGDAPGSMIAVGCLLALVASGLGLASPFLLGPAAMAGFPLGAAVDLARNGGHNLLPIEFAIYAVYAVLGVAVAKVGRKVRISLRGRVAPQAGAAGPATDTGVDRALLESELRTTLRTLAAPGREVMARVRGITDELAPGFDDLLVPFLARFGATLTSPQQERLEEVGALLREMGGRNNAALWTEEAVCNHPRWATVRRAAREALDAFGW
ncbi:MAG: hypothetical protein WAT39_15605 [Planctomycetota bacterium]